MLLVAALVLCGLTASAPPRHAHATGAVGVVVRHGDGRLLYAYIPLMGDHVTGAEALTRAGLPLNLQSSSSLGAAVCAIDGEGCAAPKEDCFCRSYGDPSYYWHYYTRGPDGAWRNANLGAGNRVLHDGDVDGWSWTAGDAGLPPVTLDGIAALVQPAPAPIPAPTLAPTATPMPTTPRIPTTPPSPSIPLALPAPVTSETVPPPVATAVPIPTTAPPLPPATPDTRSVPDTTRMPEDSQPRAVIVGPNGTMTPVQATSRPPDDGGGERAFGAFAAVALVMLVLLALAPRVAQRRGGNGGAR